MAVQNDNVYLCCRNFYTGFGLPKRSRKHSILRTPPPSAQGGSGMFRHDDTVQRVGCAVGPSQSGISQSENLPPRRCRRFGSGKNIALCWGLDLFIFYTIPMTIDCTCTGSLRQRFLNSHVDELDHKVNQGDDSPATLVSNG